MRTLTFYSDPGHAWLAIPRAEAQRVGIIDAISPCSYQSHDGATLYLEEDCDAGLYLDALQARGEPKPKLRERNAAVRESRIRSYPRFAK